MELYYFPADQPTNQQTDMRVDMAVTHPPMITSLDIKNIHTECSKITANMIVNNGHNIMKNIHDNSMVSACGLKLVTV